ncbi:MAG: transglutaminase domain-containing protein [Cellulosilyticum sp.]|nr:transglutaminase domain-containing protein [Cellulosilyticum sp.]
MNWNQLKKQHSHWMRSSLFTLGCGMLITSCLGLTHTLFVVLIGSVFIHVLFGMIDRYKKQPITYILIGILIVGLSLGTHYYEQSIVEWMKEGLISLKDSNNGQAQEKHDIWVGIMSLLSIVGLISYVGNQLKYIKSIFAIGSVLILLYMGIVQMSISKGSIFCLSVYVMLVLIEHLHRKQDESWKVTMGILPICLLLSACAIILPSKETSLSWQWVIHAYEAVLEWGQDVGAEIAFRWGGASDTFGLNFYGGERENVLGGNIGNRNDIMLKIEPLAKTHHPIYLAGNYRDTYTGKNWTCSYIEEEEELEDYKLSTYELLYGLAHENLELEDEVLIKANRIKVIYEQIRTKTLFAPAMMMSIEDLIKGRMPTYTNTGITFSKRQKMGQSYQTNFIELNTASQWFKAYVEKMEVFSFGETNEVEEEQLFSQFQGVIQKSFLKEMLRMSNLSAQLEERSCRIKAQYTTLPEDLPERITMLTKEVTKECSNQYEQLKAIEQYLKQYTYTKTPGKIPENQDFVDYFLFENQEGYCTYFATAMAVMARTLDIPTRYVEGFIMDYSDLDKGKVYNVRAEKAHAWVEAYFKGIGWIRFEPSAGYENEEYISWKNYKNQASETLLVEKELESETVGIVSSKLPEGSNEITQEQGKKRNYMSFVLDIVGGVIGLVIIVLFLKNAQYSMKFKKATLVQQYKLRFKEIVYLLGKEGFTLEPGETLLQFQERTRTCSDETIPIESFIEIYSRTRYSKKEIQEEHIKQLDEIYQYLCKVQHKKYGRVKVNYWKIVYRTYGYRQL